MTDAEFLRAFEDTTLDPFHHRDHLRATFLYLRQFGEAQTRERLGSAILRFATAKGAAGKYHETITLAWIRLMAAALDNKLDNKPDNKDFDATLAQHPELLDKNLLDRYYSTAVLQSPEARAHWVEPDKARLQSLIDKTRL